MYKIAILILLILINLNPTSIFASSNSASDNLFKFAEQNYQEYFKPSNTNYLGIENYLARYYSATDIYLGTLGSNVYVYGDVFGGLLRVGKIQDYITVPVRIDSFSPGSGYSGAEIIIYGEGFTREQKILIGDQSIDLRFVSENEVRFVIPFGENAQKELIPLSSGSIFVQVGDSNQIVIQLIDLPENTNPPGEILTAQINSISDQLANYLSEFNNLFTAVKEQNQDDPVALNFLDNLHHLASELNSKGSSELIENTKKISSLSLDTLERVLLAAQQSSIASVSPLKKEEQIEAQSITDVDLCVGEGWLTCRKDYARASRNQFYVENLLYACIPLIIPTGGAIAPVCESLALLNSISGALLNTIVAYKYGIIKQIELHLSDGRKGENLTLELNNADNNEEIPSSNAIKITGADLLISKNIRGAGILSALANTVLYLTKAEFLIPDWLKNFAEEFAVNWIDDKKTPPTTRVNVSAHVLAHLFSQKYFGDPSTSQLFPDFLDTPCTIDTGSSVAVQFPAWGAPIWVPIVPDQGMALHSIPGSPSVGSCDVKIKKELRMSVEDNIASVLNLKITRFPKITITKEIFIEKIDYPGPSYFGNESCTNTICKEYFDDHKVDINSFNLVAPSHATYWTGFGSDKCPDRVSCFVQLDLSNFNPPDVAVNSYSGIWDVKATDNETDCGEGINSYDLFTIINTNGNELSMDIRPIAWSGSLSINPNSIAFNINFPEDEGTTAESGSITFNKGTFTGSSSWSWSDGSDSCSGSSTFTGSKS